MHNNQKKNLILGFLLIVFVAIIAIIAFSKKTAVNDRAEQVSTNIPVQTEITQQIENIVTEVSDILEEKPSKKVEIIAHRGFSSKAPQNTMSAFNEAVLLGCDQIELDVQMTRDGSIVVFHDRDLKAITGVKGNIYDYKLREMAQLDAGRWFSDEYAGERIPTLKEVLQLASENDILLNLEMKDIGDKALFVPKIVRLVKEYGLEDKVIFTSFRYDYLKKVKELDSSLSIEVVSDISDSSILLADYPAEYYNLRYSNEMRPDIVRLHNSGATVYVWTIDDPWIMKKAVTMGADGVVTNCPDTLKEILE